MTREIYKQTPIRTFDGAFGEIPVFREPDEYSENYESIATDHISFHDRIDSNPFMAEDFWNACDQITIAALKKYVPLKSNLVDVGCGGGKLLEKLHGYKCFGVDISETYLAVAGPRGAKFCVASSEDLPYVDGFFDCVVCTDVLEHVMNLHAAFTELFRILKPGGILFIRTPYKENLYPYLTKEYPYKFSHLRSFDEHELKLTTEKIFGGSVVETVFGPYLCERGYFRVMPGLPGTGFTGRVLLRLVGFLSNNLKNFLLRSFYRPAEVNVIIRKPIVHCQEATNTLKN